MKYALLTIFVLATTACMNTKLALSEKWEPSSKPAYVDYMESYWWGLSGSSTVSLQKICMDQKPHALQRIRTFEDSLISVFSLGIYTPSTLRVWCGE